MVDVVEIIWLLLESLDIPKVLEASLKANVVTWMKAAQPPLRGLGLQGTLVILVAEKEPEASFSFWILRQLWDF